MVYLIAVLENWVTAARSRRLLQWAENRTLSVGGLSCCGQRALAIGRCPLIVEWPLTGENGSRHARSLTMPTNLPANTTYEYFQGSCCHASMTPHPEERGNTPADVAADKTHLLSRVIQCGASTFHGDWQNIKCIYTSSTRNKGYRRRLRRRGRN